jgi:hypothetical protein
VILELGYSMVMYIVTHEDYIRKEHNSKILENIGKNGNHGEVYLHAK